MTRETLLTRCRAAFALAWVLSLLAGATRAQVPLAEAEGLPAPGDGFTWERVGDRGIDVNGLAFGSDTTLWATGDDGPFRLDTTGGFPGHWVLIRDYVFVGSLLVLGHGPAGDTLVTALGVTKRSVDGGLTWATVYGEGRDGLFEIPPGLPHAGRVLVGDLEGIAYSDDRAASFTPSVVPDPGGNTAGADDFAALPAGSDHPGRILAAGRWGVNVSDDGGATFRESALWQVLYYDGDAVAALAEPAGAAVAGGRVNAQAHARAWYSADGGETWLPEGGGAHLLEGPPNDGGVVAALAVGGASALVVLGGGTVYRSDDAGQTWAPVGRAPEISTAVYAKAAALGPDGRLYVGLIDISAGGEGWVWRTHERLTLPAVTVSVASPGRAVTIPAGGGALTVVVRLTNAGAEAETVTLGTGVYLPNGNPYGPLSSEPVTVPAEGSVVVALTQHVPASAPAGVYRYVAYTGTWPDALRESDELAFVKVAGATPARDDPDASAWDTEVAGVEAEEARAASSGLGAAVEELSVTVSPNPARGSASVVLDLPEVGDPAGASGAERSRSVQVALYDVLGRRVATLASSDLPAGRHAFALDGAALPAGVYVVRVTAGGAVRAARVTLLR